MEQANVVSKERKIEDANKKNRLILITDRSQGRRIKNIVREGQDRQSKKKKSSRHSSDNNKGFHVEIGKLTH